jgi:SAM-dependent methyltransferase
MIYDEAYYQGRGSDPLVDYAFEFESPGRTIRQYEWSGIERAVHSLAPRPGKWLDFGSGNGAFVRYLRSRGHDQAYGHDTGGWADKARNSGIPILSGEDLAAHAGTFDVVTAIEVLEHIPDPLGALRFLRGMMKPGGLLFPTTGNAATAPADFCKWSYVVPEIHVSFFTPQALALAMRSSGFEPVHMERTSGWNQIIRFKMLKALGVKRVSPLEKAMPWPILARLADIRYKVTAHPVGRAV